MKLWWIMLPLTIGTFSVVQAALNESILQQRGVSVTTLYNTVVLLIVALLIGWLAHGFPNLLPEQMRMNGITQGFHWWYVLPGVLGYFIVSGIPVSLQAIGSGKTFVGIVAAQVLGGFLSDWVLAGDKPTSMQLAGGVMVVAGATAILGSK